MIFKRRSRPVDYWTAERVANGLRRYADEFFDGDDAHLPQTFYAYRNIVPLERRRESRRERLFPPFLAIMRYHESLLAAWNALGFEVEQRFSPNRTAEIRGEQFGFLVAVAYSHSASGSGRIWQCLCRCGRTSFVSVKNLRRGRVVSCGCYRRNEGAKKMAAKVSLDLTGRKFGKLRAIRIVGKYQKQNIWECVCDCGTAARVPTSSLTTGATGSCGCTRRETGEKRKARIAAGGEKRKVSRQIADRIGGVSVAARIVERFRERLEINGVAAGGTVLIEIAEAVERETVEEILGILNC